MKKDQGKRKEGSMKEPAKTLKEKRVAKKDKVVNKNNLDVLNNKPG
ncbi:MAG: hypothetical protein HYV28_13475 [Ignavibacteriales bacterium]|nr:hypothetical protein [Ignavibacteriales bacterium]